MQSNVIGGLGIVEFTVTEPMTAILDGRNIHPVCSTFWLVYYAEVAARRAIEPFFEHNENAVGAGIQLTHLAMAAIGSNVIVRATVVSFQKKLVRCTYTAHAKNTNTLLAEGIQDQVVMRTEVLESKVAAAVR